MHLSVCPHASASKLAHLMSPECIRVILLATFTAHYYRYFNALVGDLEVEDGQLVSNIIALYLPALGNELRKQCITSEASQVHTYVAFTSQRQEEWKFENQVFPNLIE